MQITQCAIRAVLAIAFATSGAALATDGAADAAAMAKNVGDQKFEHIPGTPECMLGTALSGDPGKGPALLMAKFASGCTVPWHWHTPDEHVMLASGVGRVEMKDAKPVMLRSGGYAMMPSKHVHQFTCVSACVMFLRSDGVFDTHYVDTGGNEITPDEALKAKKK